MKITFSPEALGDGGVEYVLSQLRGITVEVTIKDAFQSVVGTIEDAYLGVLTLTWDVPTETHTIPLDTVDEVKYL